MSDGLEVPGEVLAAAVLAQAASEGGRQDVHDAAHGCANCGAALRGRFCAQCGQAAHVHRSLLHMFEELLHGIFHFETKAWRTLPLLMFRPGRITREYIDGKRVRYVGPLPLFLFMMFAMFMTFSLTSGHEGSAGAVKISQDGKTENLTAAQALERLQAELKALPPEAARSPTQAERAEELETQISALKWMPGVAKDEGEGEKPVSAAKIHEQLTKLSSSLATPGIEQKILHAANNKELALYKIKNGAAKFAILLVPITLPFLWLLFALRRRYKMFDHAVFSFYSLSAMALLMSVLAILGTWKLGGAVGLLAIVAPPLHMYKQLRGTYELSRFAALWRTAALLFYALIALLAYFIFVVVVSM
ncbi:MAG: DUF3667 domain-containing protein [Paucibacter sp.]|nr:DUF3667 domain-containing protein [Roseateles sp.]